MSRNRSVLLASLFALLPAIASAAVNISTIGVVGSTVTVTTASAHGLTVNTGFCLSAPATVCAVTKTVINALAFTFDQPSNLTVSACSASCGTGDVAPQVVILSTAVNGPRQTIRYLRWLTTLTPIPVAGAVSAWSGNQYSGGASTAMVNALASGSFIEQQDAMSLPANLSSANLQAIFQADYALFQSAFAAGAQPGTYYGFTWNATTNSWGRQ